MTNSFEWFDQAEARFAKLFAAFVLLLVVGLIAFDIVTVALEVGFSGVQRPSDNHKAPSTTTCMPMPDGTQICDIKPPNIP